MRVAILDDIHDAYEGTPGLARLRRRADVTIFTSAFSDPARIREYDALVANRERTRFTRTLLEQLPELRIIAQTGNHVYHIDLAAAEERKIIIAKATGGGCAAASSFSPTGRRLKVKSDSRLATTVNARSRSIVLTTPPRTSPRHSGNETERHARRYPRRYP